MKIVVRIYTLVLLVAVSAHARQARQDPKPLVDTTKQPGQRPAAILKEPILLGAGETWAVISWTTNAGGKGHSRIYASTDQKNLTLVEQTLAPNAASDRVPSYQEQEYSHLVRLSNLTPGTTYYFRADSGSKTDHGPASKSHIWRFTTSIVEPAPLQRHAQLAVLRPTPKVHAQRRQSSRSGNRQLASLRSRPL